MERNSPPSQNNEDKRYHDIKKRYFSSLMLQKAPAVTVPSVENGQLERKDRNPIQRIIQKEREEWTQKLLGQETQKKRDTQPPPLSTRNTRHAVQKTEQQLWQEIEEKEKSVGPLSIKQIFEREKQSQQEGNFNPFAKTDDDIFFAPSGPSQPSASSHAPLSFQLVVEDSPPKPPQAATFSSSRNCRTLPQSGAPSMSRHLNSISTFEKPDILMSQFSEKQTTAIFVSPEQLEQKQQKITRENTSFQQEKNSSQQETISSQQETISSQQETISSQQETISSQQEKISSHQQRKDLTEKEQVPISILPTKNNSHTLYFAPVVSAELNQRTKQITSNGNGCGPLVAEKASELPIKKDNPCKDSVILANTGLGGFNLSDKAKSFQNFQIHPNTADPCGCAERTRSLSFVQKFENNKLKNTEPLPITQMKRKDFFCKITNWHSSESDSEKTPISDSSSEVSFSHDSDSHSQETKLEEEKRKKPKKFVPPHKLMYNNFNVGKDPYNRKKFEMYFKKEDLFYK